MKGGRGLGRQALSVLASPRRAPGVLTRASAEPADAKAVRTLQVAMGKLKTEHEAMRAALGMALDGWEEVASGPDQARIDRLRRRWGLESTASTDQDLTGDTAER